MVEPRPVQRKLAVILAADVAGYSRLMGVAEEGTLARLKTLRAELIDPAIAEHHGRIVKTTGDGLLVWSENPVRDQQAALNLRRWRCLGRGRRGCAGGRCRFRQIEADVSNAEPVHPLQLGAAPGRAISTMNETSAPPFSVD
jgi:class 3 adenylate cyclase